MGVDFSSHQVFCGEENYISQRSDIVKSLADYLATEGYISTENEEEADRSFVIGPPGRWLHIGDSTGSTEYADPEAFDDVTQAISLICPVVNIYMSDSAAIHFYLHRNGVIVDKYGNMDFPFIRFATDEAAREYQGHPDLWADFLLKENYVNDLRDVWTQWDGYSADTILNKTAVLFGWPPKLVSVGYTYDIEGVPLKWDEYLENEIDVDLSGFKEYHWKIAVQ